MAREVLYVPACCCPVCLPLTCVCVCVCARAQPCCLLLAVLQYFNSVTKEYTVQLHANKQEVKLELEQMLWKLGPKQEKPKAAADAAAAGGGSGAGDSLVGQRIRVWWKDDKEWYCGKVTVRE